MSYLYCQNPDCGVYLGSMGGANCKICGWVYKNSNLSPEFETKVEEKLTAQAGHLDSKHIQQKLSESIVIGEGKAASGRVKQFNYSPWANEYIILHDGVEVSGGQALEELLQEYNDL